MYLIYWEGYEVGTISKDENGFKIECTDEILIDWNDLIFQDFEKDRIFKRLEDDGFNVSNWS